MSAWRDLTAAQRIQAVKDVWQEGCSASQIADAVSSRFGCTVKRGAITGIYHRHREKLSGYSLQTPKQERPAGKPRHNPGSWKTGKNAGRRGNMFGRELKDKDRKPATVPAEPTGENGPLNLTLMQLRPGQCKWPVNDGGPFLFCGHGTEEGRPYCTEHANRAVSAAARVEQGAESVVAEAA